MDHKVQLIVLFIGGFLGWSLFVYTLLNSLCSRKKEIQMIEDITTDLEKVKEELKSLK